MERNVYICSWTRSSDGFTIWLKSRPNLRASAPTSARAEELLLRAIQESGGAMEVVMEFHPPLPKSALEEKYGSPEIYLIGGDDLLMTDAPRGTAFEAREQVEDRLRWLDAYYFRPVCRKCKHTSGRRNGMPVTLTYAPTKCDGAFGSFGNDGGPTHQIVSEDFLHLLTLDEKRRLQFQPTTRKRGRKFFELIGPDGPPYVAIAGMKISGWRCALCDHRTWGHWIEGMDIHSFVARSDLPLPLNGVHTVGTSPEVHLVAPMSRWQELIGKKGTRGFVSRQLGVVPDDEVLRLPVLVTYEERLSESQSSGRTVGQ